MINKFDDVLDPEFIPLTDTWITKVGYWFRAQRKKNARKREIHKLLTFDERWLKDAGLSRSQLVRELGYDPRELPSLAGVVEYRLMHSLTGPNGRSNFLKRRP